MSEREHIFFKGVYNMFGETASKLMFKLYVNLAHDVKLLGLILSLPFKFIQFFKESYNNQKSK